MYQDKELYRNLQENKRKIVPLVPVQKSKESKEPSIFANTIDELLRNEIKRYKELGLGDLKIIEYIFQNSLKNIYYFHARKDIPSKRIKFNKEHILNTLSVMSHEQASFYMDDVRKKIAYKGKAFEDSLALFVKFILPALKNESAENPEIIAKVLMHFIWQIKRKIANLKVQNHLCPVLINTEQGVGKSEFVRNFCFPFFVKKRGSHPQCFPFKIKLHFPLFDNRIVTQSEHLDKLTLGFVTSFEVSF